MSDLFTREPETFDGLAAPAFTEAESNFHFRSYTQERRPGFHVTDDDWPPLEIFEFRMPQVSGIQLVVTTTTIHYNIASMLNEWLRVDDNRRSPAGQWVIKNADELNRSRRYWAARRLEEMIQRKKDSIAAIQAEIASMEIKLNVDITELRSGRRLEDEERKLLAREFGAKEEDLKR